LHEALGVKSATLPPKRILSTTFVPSAWVDDELIAERKAGLATYLSKLVHTPEYEKNPILNEFLTLSAPLTAPSDDEFDLEDAVPSTLTRKAALELKAKLLEEPLPGLPEDPLPIPPTEPPVEPVPPAGDPVPTPPQTGDPAPTVPETPLPPTPAVPEVDPLATKIAAAYYPGNYDPFHPS
jgi:hypothetical protein